jgi:hypothetical protein
VGVDRQRALLAAACALAVLLAGASLAATDRGRVPGSEIDVAGSATGGTDAASSDGTATPASSESTTPPPETADSTPSRTTPTPAESAPPPASPTPSETPLPAEGNGDSASNSLVVLLGVLLLLGTAGGVVVVGLSLFRNAADDAQGGSGNRGGNLRIPGLPVDTANSFRVLAARTTSATIQFPVAAISLARASRGVATGAGSALTSAARAVRVAGRIQGSLLRSLAGSSGSGGSLLPSLSGLVPDLSRDDSGGAQLWAGETTDPADVEDTTAPEIESIDDAWAELQEMVPARRRRRDAMTPIEIARLAVDEGFPRDSVVRLTDIFRETTYGGTPPTDSRREAALRALQTIRDERGDEE